MSQLCNAPGALDLLRQYDDEPSAQQQDQDDMLTAESSQKDPSAAVEPGAVQGHTVANAAALPAAVEQPAAVPSAADGEQPTVEHSTAEVKQPPTAACAAETQQRVADGTAGQAARDTTAVPAGLSQAAARDELEHAPAMPAESADEAGAGPAPPLARHVRHTVQGAGAADGAVGAQQRAGDADAGPAADAVAAADPAQPAAESAAATDMAHPVAEAAAAADSAQPAAEAAPAPPMAETAAASDAAQSQAEASATAGSLQPAAKAVVAAESAQPTAQAAAAADPAQLAATAPAQPAALVAASADPVQAKAKGSAQPASDAGGSKLGAAAGTSRGRSRSRARSRGSRRVGQWVQNAVKAQPAAPQEATMQGGAARDSSRCGHVSQPAAVAAAEARDLEATAEQAPTPAPLNGAAEEDPAPFDAAAEQPGPSARSEGAAEVMAQAQPEASTHLSPAEATKLRRAARQQAADWPGPSAPQAAPEGAPAAAAKRSRPGKSTERPPPQRRQPARAATEQGAKGSAQAAPRQGPQPAALLPGKQSAGQRAQQPQAEGQQGKQGKQVAGQRAQQGKQGKQGKHPAAKPQAEAEQPPSLTVAAGSSPRAHGKVTWQQVAGGWWERPLNQSALKRQKLGAFNASVFEQLVGRAPETEGETEFTAVDAGTREKRTFVYRKDVDGGMYLGVRDWARAVGAHVGDLIGFRRSGKALQVRLVKASDASTSPGIAAKPVVAAAAGAGEPASKAAGRASGKAAGKAQQSTPAPTAAPPARKGKKRQRDAVTAPEPASPATAPAAAAAAAVKSPYVGLYEFNVDDGQQAPEAGAGGHADAPPAAAATVKRGRAQAAQKAAGGQARTRLAQQGVGGQANASPAQDAAGETLPQRDAGTERTFENLMDCRIETFQEGGRKWLAGYVQRQDKRRRATYIVKYDTGEHKHVNLEKTQWRLLAEPAAAHTQQQQRAAESAQQRRWQSVHEEEGREAEQPPPPAKRPRVQQVQEKQAEQTKPQQQEAVASDRAAGAEPEQQGAQKQLPHRRGRSAEPSAEGLPSEAPPAPRPGRQRKAQQAQQAQEPSLAAAAIDAAAQEQAEHSGVRVARQRSQAAGSPGAGHLGASSDAAIKHDAHEASSRRRGASADAAVAAAKKQPSASGELAVPQDHQQQGQGQQPGEAHVELDQPERQPRGKDRGRQKRAAQGALQPQAKPAVDADERVEDAELAPPVKRPRGWARQAQQPAEQADGPAAAPAPVSDAAEQPANGDALQPGAAAVPAGPADGEAALKPAAAAVSKPSRRRQPAAQRAAVAAAAPEQAAAAAAPAAAPLAAAAHGVLAPLQSLAAGEGPEPEECYWYNRPETHRQLSRDARDKRQTHEREGLVLGNCHDCQGPVFLWECRAPGCSKNYCPKCMDLYRYVLDFGQHASPSQRAMRSAFMRGTCPCCLHICVRASCRRKSLEALTKQAPVPHISTSQQLMLAYHLATRLLPHVESVMTLHTEEAYASGTSLLAAQVAQIGFGDNGQRQAHSERVLCNRCATCLENLHFRCTDEECGQELCPACTRELREQRRGGGSRGAAAPVKCPGCRSRMQPMRFVDGPQLEQLVHARQRLAAALGHGGAAGAAGADASRWLPSMLRQLCGGDLPAGGSSSAGSGQLPPWRWVQEADWLADLREMAEAGAATAAGAAQAATCVPPPVLVPPLPAQEQQQQIQKQEVQLQAQQQQAQEQQQQHNTQQQIVQQAAIHGARAPLLANGEDPCPALQQQAVQQQAMQQEAQLAVLVQAQLPVQQAQQQAQQAQQQAQQAVQIVVGPAPERHVPLLLQTGRAQQARQQQQVQEPSREHDGQASPLAESRDGFGRSKRLRKMTARAAEAAQSGDYELPGYEPSRLSEEVRQQSAPPAAPGAAAPTAAAAPPAGAAGFQHQPAYPEPSAAELQQRQWWWKTMGLPKEDVRRASQRGTQDFLWTPHVNSLQPGHPDFERNLRVFQLVWSRGEPVIVRGLSGDMGWTPESMGRVCKEGTRLQVINCSDFSKVEQYTNKDFFERYKRCSGDSIDEEGDPLPMLKLKDFPPQSDFRNVMRRHHDDFVAMLNRCLPAYSHPTHGPLNLATLLPWYTKLPDLGPKGYIAFGREAETEGAEGDSVTKMHEDLSDAVNIMLHTQHRPGAARAPARCGMDMPAAPAYGGAGAVWDLVRRQDRARLRQFFEDVLDGKVPGCPPFVHKGRQLTRDDVQDVIHDQCFMLTSTHRRLLAQRYGVHAWHFEQYEHEAVWIPGGCPHQVRNLRSSVKVALDFVSPDGLGECEQLRTEFRRLAVRELEQWQEENAGGQREVDIGGLHYADKLQVGNMVLFGFLQALSLLEAAAGGQQQVPPLPPPPEEPWRDPEENSGAAAAAEEGGAEAPPRRRRQKKTAEQQQQPVERGLDGEPLAGATTEGAKPPQQQEQEVPKRKRGRAGSN